MPLPSPKTTTAPIPVLNGLVTLFGYGLKVHVQANHLVCEDGIAYDRRIGRYHRATSGLKQLAVLTSGGFITLDALQWLYDVGASLLVIGNHGDVLVAACPPGCDYPALRRAQALTPLTETGPSIMRRLLQAKLDGQNQTLALMGKSAPKPGAPGTLPEPFNETEARAIEAQAAKGYWQAWEDVPLTFARKDKRIPAHWHTFGQRTSALNLGPRNATTPGNALLNYAYAILEGETTIGILTQGLDPGLGFMHTDQPGTLGLTYDVMEPARPAVDAWLYSFLKRQVFTKDDFWEDSRGEVRLSLPIRHLLTQAAPTFRNAAAPWIELVASELGKSGSNSIPTLLTQSKRSEGRAAHRVKQIHAINRPEASMGNAVLNRCSHCGSPIPKRRRVCDACKQKEVAPSSHRPAVSKLAALRAEGLDPAHGGNVAAKRAQTISTKAALRAKWEAAHPTLNLAAERKRYRREILPTLATLSLSRIQAALHCSPRYASRIRSGAVTPHPCHFETLQALVRKGTLVKTG